MRKYIAIISFLIAVYNVGCKSREEQLVCLHDSLEESKMQLLTRQLRRDLFDTLRSWAYEKNYENARTFKVLIWRIDEAVFISPGKDKAILLILKQGSYKYTSIPSDKPYEDERVVPTFLDYISLIYANKEPDGWHFYYQSMESFVIPRKEENVENFRPTSFERLSIIGRKILLKSYYKTGSCNYNPHFFDNWDIQNLKWQHTKIDGYNKD